MNRRLLGRFVVLFCAATLCSANTITLFNSGTNSSDVALSGSNGTVDTHYSVVETLQNAVTFFQAGYYPEDATARWIAEAADGTTAANPATFRLLFDLTGLNPATANITGNWAADNCGHVALNGGTLGGIIPFCNTATSFNTLTAFSFNSGFVSGVNTLDFILSNTGGAGALLVRDLTGTANAPGESSIPEPATWLLAGSALACLGLRRMRR